MVALEERVSGLRHLVKTDPDPRVHHRAQALLMLAQGAFVLGVARWFLVGHCASCRKRVV